MGNRLPEHDRAVCRQRPSDVASVLLVALILGAAAPTPPRVPPPHATPAPPRPPALSVRGLSVAEGKPGTTTPATFVVALSAPSKGVVTVQYATRDGTALAASGDYQPTAGTLRFEPGFTSLSVDVPVHGDDREEADEQFTLELSHAVGARIVVPVAAAEIVDDDGAAGPGVGPEIGVEDEQVGEGDSGRHPIRFTVTLSDVAPKPVKVRYATADGSAVAGEDYVATSGELTFPPGATSRAVSVAVIGDAVREGDEDFQLVLSDPVGAVLGRVVAGGLILDDDGPGAVSLESVGALERRGKPGEMMVLLVRVRAAAGGPVTGSVIQWGLDGDGELLDGTATPTDAGGVARQRLRLANAAGRSIVRAEAPGAQQAVTFQIAVSPVPD
jgi:Calx-beta domain-containing protein